MIEWFIIALVYFPNTERIEVKQMTNSFTGKQECLYYIQGTLQVGIILESPSIDSNKSIIVLQDYRFSVDLIPILIEDMKVHLLNPI